MNNLGWKRVRDKSDDTIRLRWCELKSTINYSAFKEGWPSSASIFMPLTGAESTKVVGLSFYASMRLCVRLSVCSPFYPECRVEIV